jgi:peptidoglycan/xylan/chitin deacetylase (PgdA/CDA1 family)
MKPYLIKTPKLIKFIFYNWFWSFSSKEKNIYLTFDDGPTPEITEWTLTQLKKYNAKATFFCIGKNIEAHPDIFQKIIKEGHSIGNHTNNHLNGLKTPNKVYLDNIEIASNKIGNARSNLFRPPYGKISIRQSFALRKKGYKVIMWDVLSADFDTSISNKNCLYNVIMNTRSGSIIVFHDSVKASEKLKFVLPKILGYYASKGYTFKKITI